jgi:hypothetical protein
MEWYERKRFPLEDEIIVHLEALLIDIGQFAVWWKAVLAQELEHSDKDFLLP